jgi:Lysozyme like domain
MVRVPASGGGGSWPDTLSPQQLGEAWTDYGGSSGNIIVMVAIALAESGGRKKAISPSADYGLWQINAGNFAALGLTRTTALYVEQNVHAAITLSGNGSNIAPWCTAWANPARDCGHGHLTYPQRGSAAYGQLPRAVAALGGSAGGSTPPVPTVGMARTRAEWDHVNYMVGPWARDRYNRNHATQQLAQSIAK